MKLNQDLHKELAMLKATADFHIQQLQDAIRRTFLALDVPLDSKIDLTTGEISVTKVETDDTKEG